MFKFMSIGKKQVGVIVTLIVLIFLGASYFFIYIPNNEKTVQERRFRCLQTIENNIKAKFSISVVTVNNLLNIYQDKKKLDSVIRSNNNSKYVYFKLLLKRSENVPRNEVDTIRKQLTIFSTKAFADSTRMGILFDIDPFIKPLLPADVFDNYVVFYKNVKIYETFPSGLSFKVSDSLLEVKNGITGPGIRSLKIGGTDYKVFSQPVNIGAADQVIISGFVAGKKYQKERTQLPLSVILLLLTAGIIIIVSLPWIKLYHIGNREKLTVQDGVASVLIAMLLMSLLFFAFFKYSTYLGFAKKSNPPTSADILANKITDAFRQEVHSAYRLMATADSASANDPDVSDMDCYGMGSRHDTLLDASARQVTFHAVFWLDRQGKELYNWVSDVGIPKGSDASTRDYFNNIINNNTFILNYKPGPSARAPAKKAMQMDGKMGMKMPAEVNKPKPQHTDKLAAKSQKKALRDTFYLDQITSKITGAFISVISKRSVKKNQVAALGFDLKSIDKVVMPDGYQYAIIDESGKVLYHYHPALNLNANLKNEFADSSKLVSCLEARSDTNFTAEYFGKSYNIKIKPFGDLPYSTVIFEDLDYKDTRDMEAYAFTLSMLLYLLAFLIIECSIIFFTSAKRSFFKKQFFDTSWVGPKISSHRQYNMAIFANLVIILLMVLFFHGSFFNSAIQINGSFLEYVYIILFSIVLTSLFLNSLFAKSYEESKSFKYYYKRKAIICSLLFILVIDWAAGRTLTPGHFWCLMLYEFLSAGICLLMFLFMPKLLERAQKLRGGLPFKWTFAHSFSMMATTRLVITSGIPVAFFFIYSYDYEQNLDTRYRQVHFAKDLIHKIQSDNISPDALKDIYEGRSFNYGIYYDGSSIENIRLLDNKDSLDKYKADYAYKYEDDISAGILSAFRFHVTNVELKNNNMNMPVVHGSAFFNRLTDERKDNNPSAQTYYKLGPNKYLVLNSANTNYAVENWPWLIVGVLLFYLLIYNIIRKLFALNLPSIEGWGKMDDKLLLNNDLNRLLLIVGAPGSGKLSKLKRDIRDHDMRGNDGKRLIYNEQDHSNDNVFIADMILIPDGDNEAEGCGEISAWKQCIGEAIKDHYKLVIINHLEYNIKDARTNNYKLELLEALMHKGKSKIIIISTVHPVSFLDSYNQQIRQTIIKSQAADSKPPVKLPAENELERWQVLFGHFRIIIEPLVSTEIDYSKPAIECIIRTETQYTHFLEKMIDIMPDDLNSNTKNIEAVGDSLIFKLQLTSQYFYTYIWQSLTREEKFLLYDLAEDGLVNSYDDYNLSLLISKKLIIRHDGTLSLFNKGFRNFILTAIGETELKRIKEQVKDTGSWDSLKAPLGIIILAIVIFLFTSQQEAYSRIIAYVTALSAGVPAILKIFSMVGNSRSTQKTE